MGAVPRALQKQVRPEFCKEFLEPFGEIDPMKHGFIIMILKARKIPCSIIIKEQTHQRSLKSLHPPENSWLNRNFTAPPYANILRNLKEAIVWQLYMCLAFTTNPIRS